MQKFAKFYKYKPLKIGKNIKMLHSINTELSPLLHICKFFGYKPQGLIKTANYKENRLDANPRHNYLV